MPIDTICFGLFAAPRAPVCRRNAEGAEQTADLQQLLIVLVCHQMGHPDHVDTLALLCHAIATTLKNT